MAKRDYYDILGVPRSVSADDLKKAFRKLAVQYHPDRNPGDKKAEEKFKEISEAYDTLQDAEKRQAYDQFGHAGAQGFGQGGFRPGQNPFEGFGQAGGFRGGFGGSGSNSDSFQDIFGDIFSDMFSGPRGARRGGRPPGRSRGADLRYTLNVSFEEAATGTEKTIHFIRQRNGKEDGAKLSVSIPAGVKTGQRLKLRGEGDHTENGGQPGDLYVIVNIQDHLLFKRVENDVLLDVPISYFDAVNGMTLEIPTLMGKASLKIPPGTPAGQTFRLKGKGFSSVGSSGSGDMLVKILIDVPRDLSDDQKDRLRKFNETLQASPLIQGFQEKVERLIKAKR